MSSEPSKNVKSYRTASILFAIGGLIFIIADAVSGERGVFLALGMAYFVIGIVFWQRSKKPANGVHKNEN